MTVGCNSCAKVFVLRCTIELFEINFINMHRSSWHVWNTVGLWKIRQLNWLQPKEITRRQKAHDLLQFWNYFSIRHCWYTITKEHPACCKKIFKSYGMILTIVIMECLGGCGSFVSCAGVCPNEIICCSRPSFKAWFSTRFRSSAPSYVK